MLDLIVDSLTQAWISQFLKSALNVSRTVVGAISLEAQTCTCAGLCEIHITWDGW